MKQDKGRGVVILDNTKYIEKCMTILSTDNFEKVAQDNTKKVEEKVQSTLTKIKKCDWERNIQGNLPFRFEPR